MDNYGQLVDNGLLWFCRTSNLNVGVTMECKKDFYNEWDIYK